MSPTPPSPFLHRADALFRNGGVSETDLNFVHQVTVSLPEMVIRFQIQRLESAFPLLWNLPCALFIKERCVVLLLSYERESVPRCTRAPMLNRARANSLLHLYIEKKNKLFTLALFVIAVWAFVCILINIFP